MDSARPHRGTIFVEEAEILSHEGFAGQQRVLRVTAPETAARAEPGSFVHMACGEGLPMRRPLSIMRVDPKAGWVEFLYKVVGQGTEVLSRRQTGERVNLMGPIGTPFRVDPERTRPLLLGGGVGIPPMVFLADRLRGAAGKGVSPFVLMGSEVPFPFTARPSRLLVPGMPEGVIAAMPLLEDWGIPSRLASLQGYPGCYPGYVTDLARAWLDAQDVQARRRVQLFACGPHAMLAAVARLARTYELPCQVSLEEYMACAVGGCAGCVVEVLTPAGPAMKRVCVDGPVFEARDVFP